MDLYLRALKAHNIDPNFWISQEYFDFAKFKEIVVSVCRVDKLIAVTSDETKQFIFPPISLLYGCRGITECFENGVWSDFSNASYYKSTNHELLDLEYLYDPKNFNNMIGKRWAVFRKNVRKWPRENDGKFVYRKLDQFTPAEVHHGIKNLLIKWLEKHEDIQDSEALLYYALHGEDRSILFRTDRREIVGINCWDSNWKYINFRWSICKKDPFLNEFMRYLFYTDPEIQKQNKMVNDGGVLDNPNIKAFKNKMNPIRVREVNSWKSIKNA